MSLKVGITGGIGSGKSFISHIFHDLGVPVLQADTLAKDIMVQDEELISAIRQLLGRESYLPDGTLNKDYISHRIFGDPALRNQLNAIVHPKVRRYTKAWFEKQTTPYSLYEAAILFESGAYKIMDKIIVVLAPMELRIQRIIQRDGSDRKSVSSRMHAQMSDEERKNKGDFFINNDDHHLLIPQIIKIHQMLMGEALSSQQIKDS